MHIYISCGLCYVKYRFCAYIIMTGCTYKILNKIGLLKLKYKILRGQKYPDMQSQNRDAGYERTFQI